MGKEKGVSQGKKYVVKFNFSFASIFFLCIINIRQITIAKRRLIGEIHVSFFGIVEKWMILYTLSVHF